jgi:hypothetical protein
MRGARRSVLEDVARLERENAELKTRLADARQACERPAPKRNAVKAAAAVSLGLVVGLVMLAVTTLMLPPGPGAGAYPGHEMRGGSAGVFR